MKPLLFIIGISATFILSLKNKNLPKEEQHTTSFSTAYIDSALEVKRIERMKEIFR